MSSSDTATGGYRNLRAMWENKAVDQSTSPPSRGRSPNGSTTSQQEKSPEKVRASFIAVEKAVENDQTQPTVLKSSSLTMDGTNEQAVVDDQGLGDILKGSPFVDEGAFPKEQNERSESNGVADRAAAMVKKMQLGNTNSPPVDDYVDPSAGPPIPKLGPHRLKPKPPVETPRSPAESTKQPPTPKGPFVKPKGGVAKIQGVMESAARAREEREAMANEAKQAAKYSESQNVIGTTSKADEGQPAVAPESLPTNGVTKMQQQADSNNKNNEARSVAGTTSNSKAANPKPTTTKGSVRSSAIARPARTSLPANKAPVSTTAPTTSSSAKIDESKTTEPKPVEKRVAKAPLRVAGTSTASSLAKKSSRASLNNNNDGTKSRSTTKPADEGFLARMMRPTASSAQKTHDKVQISSPPRPRQTSMRTLAPKSSRRSLNQPDDYKENVPEGSAASPVSQEAESKAVLTRPQPAGTTSS